MPHELSPTSKVVALGRPPRTPDAPLNPPVTLASTYHAGGPVGYGRHGNPTWSAFEDVIGELEGGQAVAFASGLAASSAILSLQDEQAVILAPINAYLGVLSQLRERESAGRGKLIQRDITDTAAMIQAAGSADVVWLESPTNPKLDVADISAIAAAARQAGALTVVDNTFATPLLQRPLDLGADIVLHSATKLLAGHSDVQSGVIVARDDSLVARLAEHRRLHGAIPGTMEVYLALRGVRTLAVRLDRAQANARELAGRLSQHPAVGRTRYPGFGTMIAIEVNGGAAGADQVANAVQLWVHTTSLGGVESSIERRRRWPAEDVSVAESLLRLSVGIEDVDDLWRDIASALDSAKDLAIG